MWSHGPQARTKAPAASDSQPGRRIAEPVRPTRRSGEAASVETPRRPSAPAPEFDPSLTSPAVEPWQLPTGDEAAWTPVFDAPEPEGIQPRYEALCPEGRALVDSYLSYVELGERAARSQGRR